MKTRSTLAITKKNVAITKWNISGDIMKWNRSITKWNTTLAITKKSKSSKMVISKTGITKYLKKYKMVIFRKISWFLLKVKEFHKHFTIVFVSIVGLKIQALGGFLLKSFFRAEYPPKIYFKKRKYYVIMKS